MCNLYSIAAMRDLPGVYPDSMAPIVRAADGVRQLEMMRWGMPGASSLR